MADESTSSSSSAKKSPSKKSSTKRSSSKQAPAKKSSAQKSSAQKSTSRRGSDAPRAESAPRTSPARMAATAAGQLLELTGRATEGIIGLEKQDDGWTVQVEVVEVRRIPNTTDVLALYEIDADDKGNLQGYRRIRRYARGVPGED